jgi:hypothetical protein
VRESSVQHAIRLHLGQKDDLVIWRNNTGQWKDENGNYIRYGLCPGSSDLIGLLTPSGRFFALEIKSPGGKTDKTRAEQQRLFRDLINSKGGYAAVASSVEEAEYHYQEAKRAIR